MGMSKWSIFKWQIMCCVLLHEALHCPMRCPQHVWVVAVLAGITLQPRCYLLHTPLCGRGVHTWSKGPGDGTIEHRQGCGTSSEPQPYFCGPLQGSPSAPPSSALRGPDSSCGGSLRPALHYQTRLLHAITLLSI